MYAKMYPLDGSQQSKIGQNCGLFEDHQETHNQCAKRPAVLKKPCRTPKLKKYSLFAVNINYLGQEIYPTD